MDKFPTEPARWQTGLTLDEFVKAMRTNQARMHRRSRDRFRHLISDMERWYARGLPQATVAKIRGLMAPHLERIKLETQQPRNKEH